jgi:hypothetical protein
MEFNYPCSIPQHLGSTLCCHTTLHSNCTTASPPHIITIICCSVVHLVLSTWKVNTTWCWWFVCTLHWENHVLFVRYIPTYKPSNPHINVAAPTECSRAIWHVSESSFALQVCLGAHSLHTDRCMMSCHCNICSLTTDWCSTSWQRGVFMYCVACSL